MVPAALLAAVACIGYLRRCQREVYDFLAIGRCRIFGKTGLHDLRLPSDYILGLHFLSTQAGVLGNIIASIIGYLALTVFTFAPAAYVVRAAVENISVFGISDILTVAASFIAITLAVSSILVVGLATRIKAEA